MKMIPSFVCAGGLWAGTALAQSPVTLTIDAQAPGVAIPDDFSGLSFEMQTVLPDADGKYFFSPKNQPLIALFKTLGIRSLRVGGNTADRPTIPVPGPADVDNLFAFAQAAGVKVIYTLRLREGRVENAAAIAKYIEQHYPSQLTCLAIGNEPDIYLKEYPAYLAEWEKYAAAIKAVAPGAKFCGPCATGGSTRWARNFADVFAKSGRIASIAQHDYAGGNSRSVTDVAAARGQMLSPAWLDHYETFHHAFATAALSNGVPYRFEEVNNFYNGGAENVSDTFAAALWGLDFLHWWAAHAANGVNFHTGDKVAAGEATRSCYYATFWTAGQGYNVHPIGYGIKAFALGSHGRVAPLTISNPDGINLTAYAVRDGVNLFVTVINKNHGSDARAADVTIVSQGISKRAAVIFLAAPNGDVAAKTGVTLGGAAINDNGSWRGKWAPLMSDKAGQCALKVPAASAAIVKLSLNQS